MYWDSPHPTTGRVKHAWEWGRIVWFGLIIHHIKFELPTTPRSGLKVPGGWVVGDGGALLKISGENSFIDRSYTDNLSSMRDLSLQTGL